MAGLFSDTRSPGAFGEQHERLIVGIAGQAAIALDNARLFDEAKRSQAALRRSNEELRRTNEDLEHFAYSASHDLREPLRQVAVYSQLLQRQYVSHVDARAEQFIEVIVAGAKRMDALVRDILAYTQAASIGQEEIELTDANKVLAGVLADVSSTVEESDATLETAPLPAVRVKPIHLQQLFQNLISNALKYRGPERPHISIGAENGGGEWIFFCRDNGIGIEPQYHRHVFALFKRLHSNSDYEGTGIGLAICQKIVERYGGKIWVESAAGQGATFRFSLPVSES
jgi:light-regulated signal transduction histidine kinase (bacteriophytochrome)